MVLQPEHRASMRRQAQPYRSRSLSPRAPYLWQDREGESMERQSRKGWYRVDYGPSKTEEMYYLPTFKDRMNFLERSVIRATSEPRTRATSVPPSTVSVRRSRALSEDPIITYPYRWRTWPFYYLNYRRPYSNYYDMYWPTVGPYSGRIWRLPWYRYPSSPLTVSTAWRSYPPIRYSPRYYPSYYDYDYGYGGYYYPPYYPRLSRYDYLDDLDSPYLASSYRPRALDLDTDYRDKKTTTTTTTTTSPSRVLTTYRTYTPGMLQDHVDNMRIRLKSLAYSLDPTGPVPEIVIPERTPAKKSSVPAITGPEDKKYTSSAMEFTELPKLASRRQRYYPEDEHMKDNLRIQCLSHYKTTRTAADYWKPKQYIPTEPLSVMPETTYRSANKFSSTKWEEPDTVFGGPSDKKPYSKAITDGGEEAADERKERRKKKKSKEREVPEATTESSPASTAAAAPEHSSSEADLASAPSEDAAEDEEKERKRLEKKKRKAEREAAAKAAMEAELAALAAAEAELAKLEAESTKAPAESAAAEVKSESAAEKCESRNEAVSEGVCVEPESLDEPAPPYTPPQGPSQEQVEKEPEPPAATETEQAVEPQQEPLTEQASQEDLPPLQESQEDLPVEEPQAEPDLEELPAEDAPVEVSPEAQEVPLESPVEPPLEEAPVETVEDEPLVEPEVVATEMEAAVEEAPVEETKAEEEEEVVVAPRRRPAFEEDAGWLDSWDAEGETAAGDTGPQLGTDASEDIADNPPEEAKVEENTEEATPEEAATTDAGAEAEAEAEAEPEQEAEVFAEETADAPQPTTTDDDAE